MEVKVLSQYYSSLLWRTERVPISGHFRAEQALKPDDLPTRATSQDQRALLYLTGGLPDIR